MKPPDLPAWSPAESRHNRKSPWKGSLHRTEGSLPGKAACTGQREVSLERQPAQDRGKSPWKGSVHRTEGSLPGKAACTGQREVSLERQPAQDRGKSPWKAACTGQREVSLERQPATRRSAVQSCSECHRRIGSIDGSDRTSVKAAGRRGRPAADIN